MTPGREVISEVNGLVVLFAQAQLGDVYSFFEWFSRLLSRLCCKNF